MGGIFEALFRVLRRTSGNARQNALPGPRRPKRYCEICHRQVQIHVKDLVMPAKVRAQAVCGFKAAPGKEFRGAGTFGKACNQMRLHARRRWCSPLERADLNRYSIVSAENRSDDKR